jgi:hypothetical protein
MFMDTRCIFRGGFILCSLYKCAASILLCVSAVGVLLPIFFIVPAYNHVNKQVGRDYTQQYKGSMY